MILTVTLNPLLENRFYFSEITLGKVNRSNRNEFKAGGKGINVSRQLSLLNVPNTALTFAGGSNGKTYRSILSEENINTVYISSSANTRSAALIIEKEKETITSYFEPNPEITEKEAADFKNKLEKMIVNSSIVVFSGSSPNQFTDDIVSFGIKKANELDKISVLDTYGNHLQMCIDAEPTVLHNNVDEIESSLNIKLRDEKDKIEFLKYLNSKNIKLSFLTDGGNPGYAAKYDFHYKFWTEKLKARDATGSGDAFTAGIVYGLERALVFEDFLKTASALGAANASEWSTCNVPKDKMNAFYGGVQIETLGKKMKLIDDTPDY